MRRVRDAIAARDVNVAAAALQQTSALLDRSANRGTIHRNTAARRKSRLALRLNAIKAAPKK
jgi:small subunit ribosomal protein S20